MEGSNSFNVDHDHARRIDTKSVNSKEDYSDFGSETKRERNFKLYEKNEIPEESEIKERTDETRREDDQYLVNKDSEYDQTKSLDIDKT